MSYRKGHSQGNVPFSWEDKPGVSKVTHQECPRDIGLKSSHPCHSWMMAHDKKIPPPPCPFQPLRRGSSTSKGLIGWQDDPFLAAFKECRKSVRSDKMPGESKNGVVSKVRKSKFIFSCQHSGGVEDEDPFLAALNECTKSVGSDEMPGESKNGVVSKVRKSKFIFSCKHSCDVEDDNLVRLSNLPPLPRERYRGLIKMRE